MYISICVRKAYTLIPFPPIHGNASHITGINLISSSSISVISYLIVNFIPSHL